MNLYLGDCLEVLKSLPDNSIDSLVTDPPAGISFMGKAWDDDKGGHQEWIKWMSEVMSECLRVLKPGAHGLVWAIPRTNHWTGMALQEAGFEVRDVITHLFGQGFPKSHNIEKATNGEVKGLGTALKPAVEFWYLVRKPISEKTVAANVLKWGTGGINIDGSRISGGVLESDKRTSAVAPGIFGNGTKPAKIDGEERHNPQGRFPSNLVLSHSKYCTDDQCDIECAIERLDEQSGVLKSGDLKKDQYKDGKKNKVYGEYKGFEMDARPGDSGGASRFFYCAKISTSERNAGCEDLEGKLTYDGHLNPSPNRDIRENKLRGNHHPTVKPKKLMKYLINLITPPNGVVLDPFMGSGSTGIAAKELGFDFIGIEKEKEYFEISEKRIDGHNQVRASSIST